MREEARFLWWLHAKLMLLSPHCSGRSHDRSGECWLWVFNEQRGESEPDMESFKVPAFYYEEAQDKLMTNSWLIDIRRGRRAIKHWVSHKTHVHACDTRENVKKIIERERQGKTNWTNICFWIYFTPYVSADAWAWLVEVQSAIHIWCELGWNPDNKDMCQVFHCQFWAMWTWGIRESKWAEVSV